MAITTKVTLVRFKQILAVNLNKFTASASITFLILLALALINPSTIAGYTLPDIHSKYLGLLVIILFGLPILILVLNYFSEKVRGVTSIDFDSVTAKRSLFVLSGIFWVSIGGLLFLTTITNSSYASVGLLGIVFVSITWYLICRIIFNYVKS